MIQCRVFIMHGVRTTVKISNDFWKDWHWKKSSFLFLLLLFFLLTHTLFVFVPLPQARSQIFLFIQIRIFFSFMDFFVRMHGLWIGIDKSNQNKMNSIWLHVYVWRALLYTSKYTEKKNCFDTKKIVGSSSELLSWKRILFCWELSHGKTYKS